MPFHRPFVAPKSDLYLSLSVEERHFVDTIRDMGFNETDVARAVRELGVDDRLVNAISFANTLIFCKFIFTVQVTAVGSLLYRVTSWPRL